MQLPWSKEMSQATTTTDHDEIRRWAEERGGRPSVVRTSGRGGILRFDFGEQEESLEEVSWEEFFQIFEDSNLFFLHQDEIEGGQTSRFFKFVARKGAPGARGSKRGAAKRTTSTRRESSSTSKRG